MVDDCNDGKANANVVTMAVCVKGQAQLRLESTKTASGRPHQHTVAYVNISQSSHKTDLGVLIPFYLSVMMIVLMLCTHDYSWFRTWVWIITMLDCLCKDPTVLSDNQQSLFILTKPYCALKFMSDRSSQSSLSLTSGSNGSSSDMQDNVSPSHNSAQSSNPTLLDRIRSHHSGQPTEPIRLTFSDALKFGLGSSGGGS